MVIIQVDFCIILVAFFQIKLKNIMYYCITNNYMSHNITKKSQQYGKERTWHDVWASMVSHTLNLCWGFAALLKGLTSVVVLRVERALYIHSPHRQSLPDLRLEPATFGLQVRLSNH